MKTFFITVSVIIVLAIMGTLLIDTQNTGKTNEKTKVGVVFCDSIDDRSWSQSHYEGIMNTAKELELEILYRENVEDENCYSAVEELISEGSEIIICNSFGFADGVMKSAEEHENVCFFHASGIENADNLTTYFARMYQIRYLSGIVAGMETKTNEIGYVAAFPISEVNRGINAFTLGVHSVNPEADVYVKWCNSWGDDKLIKETTENLIKNHNIDILTMHTDSVEAMNVADSNDIKIIGYHLDNSQYYPNTYLTGAVWNWENFYTPRIRECLQGNFEGENYWENISSGMIGLSPFSSNIKSETVQKVNEEFENIKSGKFDVFYGIIKDTEGNVRISEGESMSDYNMLNEFDWYVDGVIIDEN